MSIALLVVAKCFSFQKESRLNKAMLIFRLLCFFYVHWHFQNLETVLLILKATTSAPFIPALYHLTHHVLIDKGGKKTFQCLINLKSIRGRKAFILLSWFRSCYIQQHNKCTLCTNANGLSTFVHFSRVGTESIFLEFWKFITKKRAPQLIFKRGEGKFVLQ